MSQVVSSKTKATNNEQVSGIGITQIGIVGDTSDIEIVNTDFLPLGVDTTPVNVIAFGSLTVGNTDPKNLETWLAATKSLKNVQPEDKSKLIEDGLKISSGLIGECNKLLNLTGKTIAEKAISIGRVCIRLKNMKPGAGDGVRWGDWADNNIPLGVRTRQKYMLVSSRPDCHEFTHLGVDKMAILCSLTEKPKKNSNENPIKTLLNNYNISSDQDNTTSMDEFKKQVEAIIVTERLIKKGLNLGYEEIKAAIDVGVQFDKALIDRLRDSSDGGGNAGVLLSKIIDGNDTRSLTRKSDKERLKDFNTLSSQLIKTLDYLLGTFDENVDDDLTEKIDEDTFIVLMEKLEVIKSRRFGTELAGTDQIEAQSTEE